MMRRSAVVALLLFARSLSAGWGDPCETTLTLLEEFSKIQSIARCSYELFGVQDNSVEIRIRHDVTPGTGQTDLCMGAGYCGTSVEVSPYEASTTYTSTGAVKAYQMGVELESKTVTASLRTPDPVKRTCADSNYNGVCDEQEPIDKDPNQDSCPGGPPCTSPLMVNLSPGAWHLSGSDDPVLFDIDGDGASNRITWSARGSALAFVAADRNGNGVVDHGGELFGNWTVLASGARARNGFEALEELDSNGDGLVSDLDARWQLLWLWVDANHDGVSQAAELQTIDASSVTALETAYHWTGRRDPEGNFFGYESVVHVSGRRAAYYDIYFRTVP